MFSRLRKVFQKSLPAALPKADNPSKGARLTLCVDGQAGARTEEINLIELLAETFAELQRPCQTTKNEVIDKESGISFVPGIVSFNPRDDLRMGMCSTIEVRHESFPTVFFEYQHSAGETGVQALQKGFKDWSQIDLPVILDATKESAENCACLQFTCEDGTARRAVLGPVIRWSAHKDEDEGEHPAHCPCCFFTQCMNMFDQLRQIGQYAAVRVYAMRNEDGTAEVDCRINGADFLPGKDALRQYVLTWPGKGFEARKQYFIVQDVPASTLD